MNVNTFTAGLVSFALYQANVIDNKARGRDAKAALLRHAATMTDKQKAEADSHVVGALAARFDVRATKQVKQIRYSGYGFEHGSAAAQALARARRMLAPTSMEEAEAAIAALVSKVSANSADPVASLIKRFEGLTGGQKRSFLAQLGRR
jgi:hypothetical protein